MAKEPKPIDIRNVPELLQIVEQMQQNNQPSILTRDNEEVAIISLITHQKRPATSGRAVTTEDSLFQLIATGKSDIPGGVSGKKHEYLARAYRHA